jgi:glycosyltransferase involved in cell wall biosynthesis
MAHKALKIGYIWQYEASDLSPVSATALHMRGVIRALETNGHQVRVITVLQDRPHTSDDLENWQPVQAQAESSGAFRLFEKVVRGIQGRLKLPYIGFFASYRFSKAVEQALQDCDVYYERFWLNGYGGLLAAQRLGIPLVYEVNGDLVEEYHQLGIRLSRAQWAASGWIIRRIFQKAARVVTVSDTLRQRTIDRWRLDPEQVTAVSNGARVDLFSQAVSMPELREQNNLDVADLIMFVGSFKPWHGLDLLVEAFSQVVAQQPQARLVFVGDGPTRPELEAQAQQLGLAQKVIFTGAVPHEEVASWLSQAQVAILNPRVSPASLSQSPLKLFEYMAAGKAIVAPDIQNVRGVLSHRQNALLVAPDQPAALAQAISELLGDASLRQRLGETARQQALERHSWDTTAAELEAIFRQELERQPQLRSKKGQAL